MKKDFLLPEDVKKVLQNSSKIVVREDDNNENKDEICISIFKNPDSIFYGNGNEEKQNKWTLENFFTKLLQGMPWEKMLKIYGWSTNHTYRRDDGIRYFFHWGANYYAPVPLGMIKINNYFIFFN